MELNTVFVVYAALQFIAFVFVVVGTPIDMFRVKPMFREGTVPCLTLWGGKFHCFDLSYDFRPEYVFVNCTNRLMRFRVAEAFAIISIFLYGAAFVLGVLMLLCCPLLRWICLGLNIVGAVTLGVVWASMSVAYTVDEMNCSMLSFEFHYGAGFALFVAAWVLDIINIFVVVLSICTTASAESGQVEHKE
ncbi:putative amastin-like surface protein [Leishmania braziliensis MHOM/BR/75/M2904]|uniref:Amastin-like surface protein n=2 Tax=Leishmania braziliensis TaxID=5660 RepID=A4HAZ8_LEIBR|nr:putative amastin-like surface protein [Leishmania braziliensis MHOM/BR/75/M2904]CAJ2471456.1 unnamed protein product [Leishmania braziliensis]CAJ2471458.1 unnamed protein product [Leishmania braziliensis]CAJ2471460.1 unnamed protein product [Leishmania braziliensis]CAM38583.1 putative amastin-like surface protein [Leishmania braziliensis MHOM/BR/75/M2904]SYZ65279.1 amastin-like_surface_protein [Leishmania braziliensis MHOM/BR/75/M2904]